MPDPVSAAASAASQSWATPPDERIAVVFVHGQGEQTPMTDVVELVESVWRTDSRVDASGLWSRFERITMIISRPSEPYQCFSKALGRFVGRTTWADWP